MALSCDLPNQQTEIQRAENCPPHMHLEGHRQQGISSSLCGEEQGRHTSRQLIPVINQWLGIASHHASGFEAIPSMEEKKSLRAVVPSHLE
jgi:hypothetical protein